MYLNLQIHRPAFEEELSQFHREETISRIWNRDHTVWGSKADEITNRLGWLDIHERMRARLPGLNALRKNLVGEGITHALLLGMGGSSLAPETFRKTFGIASGAISLDILDSTDAGAIRDKVSKLDPKRTVYIVATKSGGTVETLSLFKHCYSLASNTIGRSSAGDHFIAITDPGSGLVPLAEKYRFREIFLNDPDIGGRYSALSYFGLLPAALIGVNTSRLLDSAERASKRSRSSESEAVHLGAALGVLARLGRDKLTLVTSRQIDSFESWIEQLIAESTGKGGTGILPVIGEDIGGPYWEDRVFAGLSLPGDDLLRENLSELEKTGHPVIRIDLDDPYELGGQFFIWEMATAVAGHVLGVHPFNQPDVETAKVQARRMVDEYLERGELPQGERTILSVEAVKNFVSGMSAGDYIGIHAYIAPDEPADKALAALRERLRQRTGAAVTAGYGPRFLHSTGQLHKGDAGRGRFIQITSNAEADLPIPDEAVSDASRMSFDTLKLAQALGDFEALRAADPPRRVVHFHLDDDPAGRISALADKLARQA